jgi:hypothetical protein
MEYLLRALDKPEIPPHEIREERSSGSQPKILDYKATSHTLHTSINLSHHQIHRSAQHNALGRQALGTHRLPADYSG